MPNMKNEMHDRLWGAFDRWLRLRQAEGVSKYDLKMQGIREHGDAQYFLRPLIFTRATLRTYERTLKPFLDYVKDRHGVTRLGDVKPRHMREWIKENIERGYAQKTLNRMRAAVCKLGALVHKRESFARMSARCGRMIREAVARGVVQGPQRLTPGIDLLRKAVERLHRLDQAVEARTGKPRGYALAARLQLETSVRIISVTERMTGDCMKADNRIVVVGKGGKIQEFTISGELHLDLRNHFSRSDGPLASYGGYRSAYRRAMAAVGARVRGTHGARRASIQEFRRSRYHELVGQGSSTQDAANASSGDAIERLGHSRDRLDHRAAYLGK